MSTNRTGLFIFRHDLRLHDNPALSQIAQQCDDLVCAFVFDDNWLEQNRFNSTHLGSHRHQFLYDALNDLDNNLKKLGQKLHILRGDFHESVTQLIEQTSTSIVGLNQHCGYDEQNNTNRLKRSCIEKQIDFIDEAETSILDLSELPFDIVDMPNVFSPFRRKVEKKNSLRTGLEKLSSLPPTPMNFSAPIIADIKPELIVNGFDDRLIGGETAALAQLDYYLFATDLLANYKQTRNQFDGWDFSSKLSAWLANGSISPAAIANAVSQYEQLRTKNDSTYWLAFELLWREFFHLQSVKHGKNLFSFEGIQQKRPTTSFDHNRFERWCHGETGYPIVDACMKQLNATGFMSNRGRQLVASCFVHELNLDWRYGAAYFEQQLIDFDVASNWGNWQYLAGVGSDPRGHRQFNLHKQTEIYDPERKFVQKWLA